MKKIGDILHGAAFAEYRARARRAENINAAVNAALATTGITARCKAISIQDGELTLAAASPAEAAMVRQLLPALKAALNKAGEAITDIKLYTQP